MASSHAITHAQRVTRLYRKALKNTLSWCIDRATWREEALRIRERFDANKHVHDRRQAKALLQQGEDELQRELHPDPYINPNAPDGTLWERNPPLPKEILQMTPDEQQWYKEYIKYHNSPMISSSVEDPTMSPYPKFVWSPTGGWYCNPPNWKRNTSLAMMFVLASSGVVWYLTAPLECLYGPGGDETEVVSNSASTLLPVSNKWPREYERVTELEEVDRNDFVAFTKSKHQRVRDRAVHREELKILQKRVSDCVRKEGVNHPQRCRSHSAAYMQSFHKYRSEGWLASH